MRGRMLRQRRMSIGSAVVLVGLIAACAGLPVKERMTQGLQSVHAAASQAQEFEISAYTAELVPRANYTEADHRRFHAGLAAVFDAEVAVASALQSWAPGDAPPASLAAAIAGAQNAVQALSSLAPDGPMGRALQYATATLNGLLTVQAQLAEAQ